MKIGFDAKRAFFNRSGLGNYSRDLITNFSYLESENEYLLYKQRDKKGIDFRYGDNTKVVTPTDLIYRKIGSLWRSFGVVKDIKRDGLDIFHGLSGELPYRINYANCRSIVTVHDCIFMRYPELYDKVYKRTFEAKVKYTLKVADVIVAISEQTKNDIVEYFHIDPNRIKVVYQGCNDIFRTEATESEKSRVTSIYNLPKEFILYVGTIESRKNLLSIFEAAAKEGIDTPIVAIGRETEYLAKVKQFVIDNGMEDRAYFLHNVETEHLPAIYQMASLFVYPSLFEGFGIPILEALCSNTPVVTTAGGVFPEVGGEAVEYAEFGNIEELGAKMALLLGDQTHADRAVALGSIECKRFEKEKITNDMFQVYKEILS